MLLSFQYITIWSVVLNKLILFVHGLSGSKETWGDFEYLIEHDDSLKDFDVKFHNYESTFNRPKNIVALFSKVLSLFTPQQRLLKIQDLADVLQTEIAVRYKDYDEIYLITHSMGGLVARKYLYDMIKNKNHIRVAKLMLYAVPNNGSDLAKLSKFYKHEQIEQLDRDSDFMQHLNRETQHIKLEDHIDILYVVGKKDEVVDEASARGYWGNTNVRSLPKGHIDIVKPINSEDISFLVLKDFLNPNSSQKETKPKAPTTQTVVEKSPFVEEVFEAIEFNRLVVCYSQDYNDIAKENELLKEYARYRFKDHFYTIDIPSFENDERRYFQSLVNSAGLRDVVNSANDWKTVMKSLLEDTKRPVMFFICDIADGNEELNTQMARIIRLLKDEYRNFHAICVGRKALAFLVHGAHKLSPLNTAIEIFFPVKKSNIPEQTVIQILKELIDDRELLCECLADEWSEQWSIWSNEKSINQLFWKNILINQNGKYAWRSQEIRSLAQNIFACQKESDSIVCEKSS